MYAAMSLELLDGTDQLNSAYEFQASTSPEQNVLSPESREESASEYSTLPSIHATCADRYKLINTNARHLIKICTPMQRMQWLI